MRGSSKKLGLFASTGPKRIQRNRHSEKASDWGVTEEQFNARGEQGYSLKTFIHESNERDLDLTSLEGWSGDELELQNEEGEGVLVPNLRQKFVPRKPKDVSDKYWAENKYWAEKQENIRRYEMWTRTGEKGPRPPFVRLTKSGKFVDE